jgi:homoserine O-acetyltransferase
MHAKFGRRLRGTEKPNFRFGVEFEVESYLDYQGQAFVERFDANSYLYITRAMDYYDAAERWGRGDLTRAADRVQADVLIVSFSSDWLYTPAQCKELAAALRQRRKQVTYVEVPSSYGHDAFLIETEKLGFLITEFLAMRYPG